MKTFSLLFAIAVLACFTGKAFADNTATASSPINVYMVEPIAITNTAGLQFGAVGAHGAGTWVLGPDGATSATGAVFAYVGTSVPTLTNPAAFTVTGTDGFGYDVTVPGTVTLGTGVWVDTWTINGPEGWSRHLTPSPSYLTIGATLNVDASAVHGALSGSFNLTVTYN